MGYTLQNYVKSWDCALLCANGFATVALWIVDAMQKQPIPFWPPPPVSLDVDLNPACYPRRVFLFVTSANVKAQNSFAFAALSGLYFPAFRSLRKSKKYARNSISYFVHVL